MKALKNKPTEKVSGEQIIARKRDEANAMLRKMDKSLLHGDRASIQKND